MDGRAMTLMNANPVDIIAVFMHIAAILLALMGVSAFKDSKEMDGHATTLMNARMGLTSVTKTQHAPTPKALTNATARLDFMVTVKYVEMLTNV